LSQSDVPHYDANICSNNGQTGGTSSGNSGTTEDGVDSTIPGMSAGSIKTVSLFALAVIICALF
jgi:hypothetical protein